MRIAVVSTPRSGNTWLRRLLARSFAADEAAAHTPDAVPWATLPESVILQLHWRPTPEFGGLLRQHGFAPVVLARHPFDVLLSVLHFCRFERQTALWLAGEGGDESAIDGVSPVSDAFAAYAHGPRAAALLSVSHRWWHEEGVRRVRYEDLMTAPVQVLSELTAALGASPVEDAEAAVERTQSFRAMREESGNFHAWSGEPGGWRRLLPATLAASIADAHRAVLDDLRYVVDAVPTLTADAADAAWWRSRVAALEDERLALSRRLRDLETRLSAA